MSDVVSPVNRKGETGRATTAADAARARLLQASIAAFSEKGFNGTTTRDIAAGAGLSPGTLYVHHKSKEELLYLIIRSGHENTLRLMEKATATIDDPVMALRQVVLDFAMDHAVLHTRARITNYELSGLTPEHYAEIRELRHRVEQEVHKLVQAGVAGGQFDTPDPRMATVALLSLGIDISRWYRDDGRWSPEYIANRYAEMAMRIVGADPASESVSQPITTLR